MLVKQHTFVLFLLVWRCSVENLVVLRVRLCDEGFCDRGKWFLILHTAHCSDVWCDTFSLQGRKKWTDFSLIGTVMISYECRIPPLKPEIHWEWNPLVTQAIMSRIIYNEAPFRLNDEPSVLTLLPGLRSSEHKNAVPRSSWSLNSGSKVHGLRLNADVLSVRSRWGACVGFGYTAHVVFIYALIRCLKLDGWLCPYCWSTYFITRPKRHAKRCAKMRCFVLVSTQKIPVKILILHLRKLIETWSICVRYQTRLRRPIS